MSYSELSPRHKASLFLSDLDEWQKGAQVLSYGAIMICRSGRREICVNYKNWTLHEGAAFIVFPNDVVELTCTGPDGAGSKPDNSADRLEEAPFRVEVLQYDASLLREASLQLEQTVYSSLREDRCRHDSPVVTRIINGMFNLLKIYFEQTECTCIPQLVLCQLKAFFIGFHEYLQRHPQYRLDEISSLRIRELFNHFMMLMERDFKQSRDVMYYARLMNITPKYLTNVVRQVTGHTPKAIIDQYVILQVKMQLQRSGQSVKEIAWDYHFTDVSFFCRYFKKHTGMTPQQIRTAASSATT